MDLLDGFIRQLETATHLLRLLVVPAAAGNTDRFGIDRTIRTYIHNQT